jgi:hypothetical protein
VASVAIASDQIAHVLAGGPVAVVSGALIDEEIFSSSGSDTVIVATDNRVSWSYTTSGDLGVATSSPGVTRPSL